MTIIGALLKEKTLPIIPTGDLRIDCHTTSLNQDIILKKIDFIGNPINKIQRNQKLSFNAYDYEIV